MSQSNCNRRAFLRFALACGVAAQCPRLAFASAQTESRFVFVILRGALDGLAAAPALGDGDYSRIRGQLAIQSRIHNLDGFFALHPSMPHLFQLYRSRELALIHATATPYRERSHFDGQDVLEAGSNMHPVSADGWLNRVVSVLPGPTRADDFAIALSPNIPLVLQGAAKVASWAPSRLPNVDDDTLQRLADLYARDEYLGARLQSALATEALGEQMNSSAGAPGPKNLQPLFEAAGRFLAAAAGPRIAVLETTGWDTHANQGAEEGMLANRLGALDDALNALRTSLGDAWKHSAVFVATEFGRTVAINGTRGTDHGTGTCAFLLGGAVNGGRVIADWPGLQSSALYEGRDLRPTTDLRAILKGVLGDHLNISEAELANVVFPNSHAVQPKEGLIRSRVVG